jgi:gliding motility-associated lipoprotein GldD
MEPMNKKNSCPGISLLVALALTLTACKDMVTMPKPKGWPRIDLPEHSYKPYGNEVCPFTFELPAMAEPDSIRTDSCWVNFYMPDLGCKWHITYRHIPSSGKSRAANFEEYHSLVYKHIQKSTRINQVPISTPFGEGMLYELYGTVGVPAQVIFGDSTHLLMTSFYFDSAVNGDSLSPVINFVKDDLRHMVETLRWK